MVKVPPTLLLSIHHVIAVVPFRSRPYNEDGSWNRDFIRKAGDRNPTIIC